MYPFNPEAVPEYAFSQESVGLPSDIPDVCAIKEIKTNHT